MAIHIYLPATKSKVRDYQLPSPFKKGDDWLGKTYRSVVGREEELARALSGAKRAKPQDPKQISHLEQELIQAKNWLRNAQLVMHNLKSNEWYSKTPSGKIAIIKAKDAVHPDVKSSGVINKIVEYYKKLELGSTSSLNLWSKSDTELKSILKELEDRWKAYTKDAPEDDDQILRIQNKYNCTRTEAARRYYSGERVKDADETTFFEGTVGQFKADVKKIYPTANFAEAQFREGYREVTAKLGVKEIGGIRELPTGKFRGGWKKSLVKDAAADPSTIPELKAHVEAYNQALKNFRAGVAQGNEILRTERNVEKKNALLKPLQQKMGQAEKAANTAIKAYSQKTGVNLELVGFHSPFISKYN